MTTLDQYRTYARESMKSAAKAKTEAERQAFLLLARTWEQAALHIEGHPLIGDRTHPCAAR